MFDPAIRFFQGRDAAGRWKSSPTDYDPRVWGHEHDYTETDGWNFAFHTPHDGQGLANLYGGRDALARKLDTFFATPETANFPGSYGGTIHEMIEARDVRMGQWGFSNQVSHHIPYMYDYAGQPAKTQEKVREVLRRLYLGSRDRPGLRRRRGQRRDVGLVPLQRARLLPAAGGERELRDRLAAVQAGDGPPRERPRPRRQGAEQQRAQRLRAGAQAQRPAYDRSYISHQRHRQRRHARVRHGPDPSQLGDRQGRRAAVGDAGRRPGRSRCATRTAATTAPRRRAAATRGAVRQRLEHRSPADGARPWLQYRFTGSRPVTFYTLTSGTAAGGDPSAWVVKGSNDGSRWDVLDERSDETFRWRSQTRPFKLARPAATPLPDRGHRGRRPLGEVELLNPGKADTSPLVTDVDRVVASAGDTPCRCDVTVSNYGDGAASGTVAATVQDWRSSPRARRSGRWPTASRRRSSFHVSVPAGTRRRTYPVKVKASSNLGVLEGRRGVRLGHGHRRPRRVHARHRRRAAVAVRLGRLRSSTARCSTATGASPTAARLRPHRFELPADVQGGTLTLDIGNQFLVEASTDNPTWTTVLKEDAQERDLGNPPRAHARPQRAARRRPHRLPPARRQLPATAGAAGWRAWMLDLQRGG